MQYSLQQLFIARLLRAELHYAYELSELGLRYTPHKGVVTLTNALRKSLIKSNPRDNTRAKKEAYGGFGSLDRFLQTGPNPTRVQ